MFFDKQNSMEKCTGQDTIFAEVGCYFRNKYGRTKGHVVCYGFGVGTQLGAEHVAQFYYQLRFVSKSRKENPRKSHPLSYTSNTYTL